MIEGIFQHIHCIGSLLEDSEMMRVALQPCVSRHNMYCTQILKEVTAYMYSKFDFLPGTNQKLVQNEVTPASSVRIGVLVRKEKTYSITVW